MTAHELRNPVNILKLNNTDCNANKNLIKKISNTKSYIWKTMIIMIEVIVCNARSLLTLHSLNHQLLLFAFIALYYFVHNWPK